MRCHEATSFPKSCDLLPDHGPILSAFGHQFRVGTRLANPAIFDDDKLIRKFLIGWADSTVEVPSDLAKRIGYSARAR